MEPLPRHESTRIDHVLGDQDQANDPEIDIDWDPDESSGIGAGSGSASGTPNRPIIYRSIISSPETESPTSGDGIELERPRRPLAPISELSLSGKADQLDSSAAAVAPEEKDAGVNALFVSRKRKAYELDSNWAWLFQPPVKANRPVYRTKKRSILWSPRKRIQFPISVEDSAESYFASARDGQSASKKPRTLSEALSSPDHNTRVQGFYDLKTIIEMDEPRLQELFLLSHPGGNPHNWQSVFVPIQEYLTQVRGLFKITLDDLMNVNVSPQGGTGPRMGDPFPSHSQATYASMGQLGYQPQGQPIISSGTNLVAVEQPKDLKYAYNIIVTFLQSPMPVFQAVLVDLFGLMAKAGSLLYTRVFRKELKFEPITPHLTQPVLIWIVEILVNISVISLTKDANGALQSSLAQIVGILVEFYETIHEFHERIVFLKYSKTEDLRVLVLSYRSGLRRLYFHLEPFADVLQIPPRVMTSWRKCQEYHAHIN